MTDPREPSSPAGGPWAPEPWQQEQSWHQEPNWQQRQGWQQQPNWQQDQSWSQAPPPWSQGEWSHGEWSQGQHAQGLHAQGQWSHGEWSQERTWDQVPPSWQPAPPWGQSAPPWQPAPPRRRRPTLVVLIAILAVALISGAGVARAVLHAAATATGTASTGGTPAGLTAPRPGTAADPQTVADLVTPGIVDVNTTLGLQGARAAGTGIVLSSTGEVLTNNHVIAGATDISVTDIGNGQTYQATVVGYDRTEDIAVLRLSGASGLRTAPLGDSSKIASGSGVVAIGNAGGVGGAPSVVSGTVTATDQSITATDENGANAERLTGLIQVAADIQPGDSGGPLVDASGRVIGVDTAASTGFRFQSGGGTGFAIPINQAMTIAKQIQAGKASATVHIGPTAILGVQVLARQATAGNGNATGGTGGAPVAAVVSGSPADEAGLGRGDVIVSLDGRTIDAASTLTTLLDGHHPGDRVSLGWVDAFGSSHTATVRLATGPAA